MLGAFTYDWRGAAIRRGWWEIAALDKRVVPKAMTVRKLATKARQDMHNKKTLLEASGRSLIWKIACQYGNDSLHGIPLRLLM